jgi:outer membrane protein assembly factor BamB
MSLVPETKPRPSWVSRVIFWFPLALLVVLIAGVLTLREFMIQTEQDPAFWILGVWMGLLIEGACLFLWLLIARMPWRCRVAGLALLFSPVLAAVVLLEDFRVTGDMRPSLRWRFFGRPHEELLQDQLAGTTNQPVPTDVDLSGRRPGDWAEYRGPRRDGVVIGPDLLRNWNTTGPREVWPKRLIGGGHAAFIVVDKVLFTMEQRDKNEVVTCYDAATGKQIWAFAYPAFFDDMAGDKGPRATPTVVDGDLYAFGATGLLHCLDARTGTVKWGPIDTLAGNTNVQWGMSASPLVHEDLVIVNVGVQKEGAPNGTLVAFERKSGSIRWSSGTANAGYSSPQISTVAGKTQVLLFDGEGLSGYDLADKGKQLWRFAWKPNPPVNVGQPLLIGDNRIFISSGYGLGCALVEVTETNGIWSAKQIWKNPRLACKFTNPAYYEGHIYGLHNGASLVCLAAETGQRKWQGSNYGNGQLLLCKDLLVIQSEAGPVFLVQASPDEERQLGRLNVFDERSWNVPALADGKLYLRNNREMACYDLAAGH